MKVLIIVGEPRIKTTIFWKYTELFNILKIFSGVTCKKYF